MRVHLLGVDSRLEGLENLDLNLGSELLLLGGTRGSNTLGLSKVVANGLRKFQYVSESKMKG